MKSSTEYVCLYTLISGRKKAALAECCPTGTLCFDTSIPGPEWWTVRFYSQKTPAQSYMLNVIVGVKYKHFLPWVLQNACTVSHVIAWMYFPASAGRCLPIFIVLSLPILTHLSKVVTALVLRHKLLSSLPFCIQSTFQNVITLNCACLLHFSIFPGLFYRIRLLFTISVTECNNGTIQKRPILSYYYDWPKKCNKYMRQDCHLAGYVSTNKRAVLLDVPFIFFSSIVVLTPNGNFLHCATLAFSERHTHNLPPFLVPPSYCECKLLSISTGVHLTILLRSIKLVNFSQTRPLFLLAYFNSLIQYNTIKYNVLMY